MTKTDLQKELLEKIKPGTKSSDLKKQKVKNSPKDEGYSSGEEEKNIPTSPIAPNQKIKELETQISSLKKQLQTYKDFKEADLKIKEKYKEEIKQLKEQSKSLNKTIQDLQKQVKSQGEVKENKIKTFSCYNCKNQQNLSLLVLELPEGRLCQPCWQILRKKTKEQVNPTLNTSQLFTCIVCDQEKNKTPIYKKVDISYKKLVRGKEYPVCSACSPHVKEYNEDENRELDIWE